MPKAVTTKREKLHRLADELSDTDVKVAVRVLEALRLADDPVLRSMKSAPLDDEADDDDFDGGLTEARRDADAGRGVSTEETERRLGLK